MAQRTRLVSPLPGALIQFVLCGFLVRFTFWCRVTILKTFADLCVISGTGFSCDTAKLSP